MMGCVYPPTSFVRQLGRAVPMAWRTLSAAERRWVASNSNNDGESALAA